MSGLTSAACLTASYPIVLRAASRLMGVMGPFCPGLTVNESFGLYVIVLVCVAAPKNWPRFPSFVENAATVVVVVTVTVPSLFVVDVVEVLTARLALD